MEGGVPATRGAPISAEELAARLERHEVTIVHLRSDLNAYLASHLPGAVYLHYETLRAAQAGVPGDVLSAAGYAAIWGRIGMRQDRPVYAVQGITPDKQSSSTATPATRRATPTSPCDSSSSIHT